MSKAKGKVPGVLGKANVVFILDHQAFSGDLPPGINPMHLLGNRFKKLKTKGQVIGVFQGDTVYMTLDDEAYNEYRQVTTGNPYKERIFELIKQGARIEECVVPIHNCRMGKEDLLPGEKENTHAWFS